MGATYFGKHHKSYLEDICAELPNTPENKKLIKRLLDPTNQGAITDAGGYLEALNKAYEQANTKLVQGGSLNNEVLELAEKYKELEKYLLAEKDTPDPQRSLVALRSISIKSNVPGNYDPQNLNRIKPLENGETIHVRLFTPDLIGKGEQYDQTWGSVAIEVSESGNRVTLKDFDKIGVYNDKGGYKDNNFTGSLIPGRTAKLQSQALDALVDAAIASKLGHPIPDGNPITIPEFDAKAYNSKKSFGKSAHHDQMFSLMKKMVNKGLIIDKKILDALPLEDREKLDKIRNQYLDDRRLGRDSSMNLDGGMRAILRNDQEHELAIELNPSPNAQNINNQPPQTPSLSFVPPLNVENQTPLDVFGGASAPPVSETESSSLEDDSKEDDPNLLMGAEEPTAPTLSSSDSEYGNETIAPEKKVINDKDLEDGDSTLEDSENDGDNALEDSENDKDESSYLSSSSIS